MRLRHLAAAALVAISTLAPSKPAHAQLMLGGLQGSSDPNQIGGAWAFAVLVTMGAMVPQSFAADALIRGKPNMDRTAGGAILAGGAAAAAGTTIWLGFNRNQEGSTALSMMGGMLWSAAGVGLGRTVSDNVNAPWLGGSMGFTTFALIHGLMEFGELSDNTGASVMQAIYATLGGAGCAIDAASSSGAERGVAIGCSVVSTAALAHGLVMAVIHPDLSHRNAPEPKHHHGMVLPSPWFAHGAAGATVGGVF